MLTHRQNPYYDEQYGEKGAKTAETANPRKGRRSDRGFTSLPGSLLFWMCSVHDSTVWQPITCPSSAAISLWVCSSLGKQIVAEFFSLASSGPCTGTNLKAHLKRNAYGSAWKNWMFLASDQWGNCAFATERAPTEILIQLSSSENKIFALPLPLLCWIHFTP